MEFSVNSPILFIIVGVIIAIVLGQSVFFLLKALKRSKEINMDQEQIKKTVTSSILFTIAPAIAILVGVFTLSKSLGIAIPWLRLSIIGSLTYETTAAGIAVEALGENLSTTITDPSVFVTVIAVMTFGILIGLILIPLFTKKIHTGVMKIENKDKKWGELLNSSMFLGMISAFLGFVFCDINRLWKSENGIYTVVNKDKVSTYTSTSGLIPVCVMFVSALVMALLGILSKKTNKRWITDYALPIALVAGMASAVLFTNLLG